ncbi:MAG: sugar phosphate nucleotidyltransferase [Acutalibacteraceae bacterium]
MEAMGIIFSNIYDNNMGELTRERTSASIPFGSRYRQIDFALSNMANSKISNIGIVTKYNYQSLMDHLGNCEEWDLKLGEGVRFLPPYATGHTGAYRGKLEALQTAMPVLGRCDAEYVVLSGYDRSVRDQFCGSSGCAHRLRLRYHSYCQGGPRQRQDPSAAGRQARRRR